MDFVIMLLIYLPLTVFIVMTVFVLRNAVRFGAEDLQFINVTIGVGVFAAVVLTLCGILSGSKNYWTFLLPMICLLFAVLLKPIVRFFVEDFDKKHQIEVQRDEKIHEYSSGLEDPNDFFDEDKRFNGKFKDYDDND